MAIAKYQDPTSSLISNFLTDSFGELFPSRSNRSWPMVNIAETDDYVTLEAELPGMSKDDIDIELEDDVLTISGERIQQVDNYNHREMRYGKFSRSFRAPEGTTASDIDASYKSGVLRLKVPKSNKSSPTTQKIQIS